MERDISQFANDLEFIDLLADHCGNCTNLLDFLGKWENAGEACCLDNLIEHVAGIRKYVLEKVKAKMVL